MRKDGLNIEDVAPPRHTQFFPNGTGNFEYTEIGGLQGNGFATTDSIPMAEAPSRAT